MLSRRELLKAIAALPPLRSIEVARLQPDDVIVIESERILSHDQIHNLIHCAEQLWPGRRVAVLDAGLTMKIVKQA